MAKLPNKMVIEITDTDKVDELGCPVVDFESKDYAECVIEELEKIKAEIKRYVDVNKNSKDIYLAGCGDGAYHTLATINKRIFELKNEAYRELDLVDTISEQEIVIPYLDKIRAEIEQLRLHKAKYLTSDSKVCIDSQSVLDIIDKYKAESEE